MAGRFAILGIIGYLAGMLAPAAAQDTVSFSVKALPAIGGVGVVIIIMSVLVASILTTKRLRGSSLFNRLFVVVAISSGFFSGLM